MVDDDLTICDYIRELLVNNGYEFVSQNRASEAIKNIQQEKPDLILLDLHLPDGDGLQLCQKIKRTASVEDIPVLILTTREFSIERDIAFEAGASAFIQKPFTEENLLSNIDEFVSPHIEFTFWGVRGSTPCANKENMLFGGNTTCAHIKIPDNDHQLILDSGSGIRNLGDRLVNHGEPIEGRIFITHPHWDHIQGFPFFKPFYEPENSFTIHMPDQLEGSCKEVLSGQMTYTYFPVTPEMLMASIDYQTQTPKRSEYEGYSVEFMISNHPISTAIYKVTIQDKIIIFCPDNELIPESKKNNNAFYRHLLEFFDHADILVHDGQYNRDIYKNRRNWGHSAWEDAVELGIEANVKNMFVTHHDPSSTDDYLLNVEEEMKEAYSDHFETLALAKEHDSIRLRLDEKKGS